MKKLLNRNVIWAFVFLVWLGFISGFKTKTPGLLQVHRLRNVLSQQRTTLARSEEKLLDIDNQILNLKENRHYQEAEIRRVLGYTSDNELVFEFK